MKKDFFNYQDKDNRLFMSLSSLQESSNIVGVSDKVDGIITNIKITTTNGLGWSFGNLLRRSFMGSNFIDHIAPVAVSLNGVKSIFQNIPGIIETTVEIVNNLSELIFVADKNVDLTSIFLGIEKKVSGDIFASDFSLPSGVNIINKQKKICTLSESLNINFKIFLAKGFGFVKDIEHVFSPKLPEDFFAIDTNFSRIRSCKLNVESNTASSVYDIIELEIESQVSIKDYFFTICKSFRNLLDDILKQFHQDENQQELSFRSETSLHSIFKDPSIRLILRELDASTVNDLTPDVLQKIKIRLETPQKYKEFIIAIENSQNNTEMLL